MTTATTEIWGAALGFQQMISVSSATAPTVPAGADIAVIQVDTQDARWRDDDTSPTASIGMLIRTTDQPYVYRGNLGRIKFIEATSGSVINISYYGTKPPSN